MRSFLIAFVCACGGVPPSPLPVHEPARAVRRVAPREPVDVVAALSQPMTDAAAIIPGPAQLVLGGAPLQALDGQPELEVDVLEQQGNEVRVGVRLPNAHFALWMSRARMLGILTRDVRIEEPGVPTAFGLDAISVILHAGTHVHRLARSQQQTQIRYIGALEVEGWVPSDAIGDRGPAGRNKHGRIPTGRKTLMVIPGAVIRTEPKWAAHQLAVVNESYFLDTINVIDDAWVEIGYDDDDVRVHGYVSRRDPPGRTHRPPTPEPSANPVSPNVTLPDQTCLYAGGEPIGMLVGAQPALVANGDRIGWYTITIDTPWSAISFDAKGSSETELAPCGQ